MPPAPSTLLDLSALEALAATPEELRHFAALWRTQAEKDVKRLSESRVDGDCHEWVAAAHTLKGGAATLGAERLRAICERAQLMNPASKPDRDAICAEVQKGIEDVVVFLKEKSLLT